MSFRAKYAGWCDDCDGRIRIDDEVTYTEDRDLVHVDCADAHEPARKAEVCGECWLTKPCDCEEAA